ncbi:MAG TPA: OmpH family outer membrane protein [Verrucomicrobiae bacterium]|jgi:outer membrane protein|nr:OmpH family outer membrane protein [Verrucomicrobiae bacterium]
MKRILSVTLLFVFLVSAVSPAMAQGRVATIDLRKVFDKYWKREQAEAALKERGTGMDKEYKGFRDDYVKQQDEYTKLVAAANDQSVTAEERDKRKTAAETKLAEIKTTENTMRQFEENAREQLDTSKKRMRDDILKDIRAAISAKAKAAGYSLVIDSAAESINQTPILLYNNGENDMTDTILSQLNAGAPAGTVTDSSSKSDDTGTKK